LEHKIIEILLIYGNLEDDFEDVLLKTGETGEMVEVKEKNKYKVYQRIYLSLQEDETELANPLFREIYNHLIAYFNQNESFELDHYLSHLAPELSQEVTSILMNDERDILGNWEAKNIFVKQKTETISQYVTETILTLRWFLVNKIIDELKTSIGKESELDNSEALSMVIDYLGLTNMFSKKLGRVISRHN
jgi:DNA primase